MEEVNVDDGIVRKEGDKILRAYFGDGIGAAYGIEVYEISKVDVQNLIKEFEEKIKTLKGFINE